MNTYRIRIEPCDPGQMVPDLTGSLLGPYGAEVPMGVPLDLKMKIGSGTAINVNNQLTILYRLINLVNNGDASVATAAGAVSDAINTAFDLQ